MYVSSTSSYSYIPLLGTDLLSGDADLMQVGDFTGFSRIVNLGRRRAGFIMLLYERTYTLLKLVLNSIYLLTVRIYVQNTVYKKGLYNFIRIVNMFLFLQLSVLLL